MVDLLFLPEDPDRAGLDPVSSEDRPEDLRAPGAYQSRKGQDLALVKPERDIPEAVSRETFHLEDHLVIDDPVSRRIGILEVTADHLADQPVLVDIGNVLVDDVLAVAQDRHPVAELKEFFKTVRNVNDRDAVRLELADDREKDLDLIVGQRVCRLVHDQDLGPETERFCHFYHLLLRDAEALDRHLIVWQRAVRDVVEVSGGKFVFFSAADKAAPVFFMAEHHVFDGVQLTGLVQLLIDDGDTLVDRVLRVQRHKVLAEHFDRSLIRFINAGKNFHQRRFAGAVFTDQGVDLALANFKVDLIESCHF